MRISDWSSDVCSSDLIDRVLTRKLRGRGGPEYAPVPLDGLVEGVAALIRADIGDRFSIRNPRWLAGGASKLQMAFDLEWSGKSGEGARSEEHTSELQSLMRISYAVFCLKKKKTQN